ncbi:lytic transglycosylase [Alkalimarinus sediminis]|uniref:LysM peptidoglycan-binding domain-containing protein n=1 Tax=Alkalimarinus sediminis TaxID=1632866 RepID=A0A9E8HNA5_9ALTE|nr:LysM peptidoglycan-binding domain-containing protein [Alkalimarinus sediminis]UZW76081.1 LysM peptidoglycan-binding domain-containing protein [Alkalimarinus sediminis]
MFRISVFTVIIFLISACAHHPSSNNEDISDIDSQSTTEADTDSDSNSEDEGSFFSLFNLQESLFQSEEIVVTTETGSEETTEQENSEAHSGESYRNNCVDVDCSDITTEFAQKLAEAETTNPFKDITGNQDLWVRMRSGFALDLDIDNPRFNSQFNWYKKHQRYIDRTTARSSRYLYHIVQETEKRGMPLELALLPIVESAFDPFAYSHGRASGIWQFIPGTGKAFGLKQDWWYDGRRDIVASTDAALTYLQALANRFDGDWLLALAAYNSGGGTVSKAIRYNKKRGLDTDFWSLKLPKETRAYVPKLLAISKLIKEPEKHGITLQSLPNEPYFDIVKVGSQIDLAQAADMADITVEELYLLNPGFNRWATSPLGPHRLLIPTTNSDKFKTALAELPSSKRVSWQRYTVKSGDSLIRIANKFNTTPSVIRQTNNLRSNMIRQGQKLLIPVATKGNDYYAFSSDNRIEKKQNVAPRGKSTSKIEYTVRSGDTLWDISRKYNVGVRSLAKWNSMAPTDPLKPGKKLVIWTKAAPSTVTSRYTPPSRSNIRKVGYRVRKGDSLARIAGKFNVTVKQIVTWNNIDPNKYLKPGQKLKLHVDVTNGS